MAKTKPTGVRFDPDLLKDLKKKKLASTPQQALNYLTELYMNRIHVLEGPKEKVILKAVVTPDQRRESSYLLQRRQLKAKSSKE